MVEKGSGKRYVAELQEALKGTSELRDSMLVSAVYNGDRRVAVLKFYNPETKSIHLWYDDTGHKPYCYIKPEAISSGVLEELKKRPDVVGVERVEKEDLVNDRKIEVYKVLATDPLAIGGSAYEKSIRNIVEAWEADIKYYENYLYDRGLVTGAFYSIKDGKIRPTRFGLPDAIRKGLEKILEKARPEFKESIESWTELLSQPLPELRRMALDIEVKPQEVNRIPDPNEAKEQVIAVSMISSDGLRVVLLLRRKDVVEGVKNLEGGVDVELFDDEGSLIAGVFHRITQYPFIITFNGDDFDLNYLYHRALKLGFSREEIPISLGKDVAYVKPGVHLDLYKTFMNRSIQVYAFGGKYSEHTLSGVGEALIGESKIEFEGSLGELPLYELARYCYQDAKITYDLTAFNDSLLMKLLMVIGRVAKMPIDDVARLAVSNWIRSMMYFEHRRISALIPRKEELEAREEGVVSEPIIKGKKYKGAIVVEPKAGVYFNVSVLDFASLYPSIIKVHNLSYETVRCIHPECRSNTVPETAHWVCTKRMGIASLVIGSLRDIRVDYYKPLAKHTSLKADERALYNVISQALKVILNASYGVMGSEIYPLYYLPAADATAALGRYIITGTIERCGQLGIEVLYGDTDSLFLRSPSEEQVKRVTEWALEELAIELDLEKTYRYVAFSSRKKNYLGVLPDGSVDIKGLTGKKSHTPPFIREAFYDAVEILSRVRSEEDFEKAREEIRGSIQGKYLALKSRSIPLQELTFNVMIGKPPEKYTETTPQHVKAALLLKKHEGREIKAGDIISFVKTSTPYGVKPLSMASPGEIDTEKYVEYMRSTFDQLLDALGYEFDEIMGSTKLEDFFWPS